MRARDACANARCTAPAARLCDTPSILGVMGPVERARAWIVGDAVCCWQNNCVVGNRPESETGAIGG